MRAQARKAAHGTERKLVPLPQVTERQRHSAELLLLFSVPPTDPACALQLHRTARPWPRGLENKPSSEGCLLLGGLGVQGLLMLHSGCPEVFQHHSSVLGGHSYLAGPAVGGTGTFLRRLTSVRHRQAYPGAVQTFQHYWQKSKTTPTQT